MKNPKLVKEAVWTFVRIAVGGIFIYASIYKIGDPAAFARQIYNYRILPAYLINPIAIVLPWIQLVCGVSLVLNRLLLGSSVLITGMMAVFQAALISALYRNLNVSCGCFASGGSPATWITAARDGLIFLAAAAIMVRVFRTRKPATVSGLWMDERRL